MREAFEGKRILVTGGTGSIGSEIVRQLLEYGPKVVRILSRDEHKQFVLRQRLGARSDVRYLLGDIRDRYRLKRAMEGVDIVFHAAALKHVPTCEYNPFEAVQTNVIGTQHVIEAALDAGVSEVIGISTDKATSPTNTMGATKLLSERLITCASVWAKGVRLACARFGNVIGSRGSLVPIIKEQIRQGGPVTITDRRMTRFMMSISDAVGLVLKASTMCKGGEVFILKMPALRIEDLVEVMVEKLARGYGFSASEIEISDMGIRPGEHLEERLLTEAESWRTVELEDVFVVTPEFGANEWGEGKEVAREKYISSEARLLNKKEIGKLLGRAGAFEG